MTPLITGLKLWARAIILNAVVMGIGFIPVCNVFAIAVFFAILLGSIILTCPLIPAIGGLLWVYARLPYHTTDKFTWLLFVLIGITAGYYILFMYLFLPMLPAPLAVFIYGTSIAVAAAAFWTKSSIIQLNNYHYEQHLV